MCLREKTKVLILLLVCLCWKKKNVFAALCFKIYLFPFGNTFKLYCFFYLALCFLFFHHSIVKVVSHARLGRGGMIYCVFEEQISLKCMYENESRERTLMLSFCFQRV